MVFDVWRTYQVPSRVGFQNWVLPPNPANSSDAVRLWPFVGKIGWSTVFSTSEGVTLLMMRRPPWLWSRASAKNGLKDSSAGLSVR